LVLKQVPVIFPQSRTQFFRFETGDVFDRTNLRFVVGAGDWIPADLNPFQIMWTRAGINAARFIHYFRAGPWWKLSGNRNFRVRGKFHQLKNRSFSTDLYMKGYPMTILEMLEQSTILTVLGMTVVFAFLWIMIVCVNIAGKVIHKTGLDKDVSEPPAYASPAARAGTPPPVAAAITAAVTEYQKKDEQR
jgi:oxaloacetate decarboxylase gamma subunit